MDKRQGILVYKIRVDHVYSRTMVNRRVRGDIVDAATLESKMSREMATLSTLFFGVVEKIRFPFGGC